MNVWKANLTVKILLILEMQVSCDCDHEVYYLLGCVTTYSGRCVLTCEMKLPPSSSGQMLQVEASLTHLYIVHRKHGSMSQLNVGLSFGNRIGKDT